MERISADIAAPTRPATIRAVSTGASSRQSETETTAPTAEPIPSLLNWKNVCAENTAPVNAPVIMTTSCESNPTSTTWLRNNFHRSLWGKRKENVSEARGTIPPENGTKRVSSEQDEFAEILDERDQRRAEGAKEANHYGRSDQR